MADRNGQQAPPGGAEITEGAIASLEVFSKEIAKRLPDRFVQRFVMPKNVREAREVFFMEITSKDEIAAAAMADAFMSPQERASVRMTADAERRECIRAAIVGIAEGPPPAPPPALPVPAVYRHTNHNGLPFTEINEWTSKAWAALHTYFAQLNGVPQDELRSGIEGAQTVGAFAPPTSAIPASADQGR